MASARRVLAGVLGGVLASAFVLALVPHALAAAKPYEHVWQVEGMVGGDLGGSADKRVVTDEMTLGFGDGRYEGAVHYVDRLGLEQGDVMGQWASIDLTLTGSQLKGGTQAGGTFAGTARLVEKGLNDIAEVIGQTQPPVGADSVVYDVSGHWGANVSGAAAKGEILFQSATVRATSRASISPKDATWFNRFSTANPDQLGGSQTFEVAVRGLTGPPPATGPGDTTAHDTRTPAPTPAAVAQQSKLSFWQYLQRGLSGGPPTPPTPVPEGLSKPALALLDAKPLDAMAMPEGSIAVDVQVSGAMLDEKNRAAGLLGDSGPEGAAGPLLKAWANARGANLRFMSSWIFVPTTPETLADRLGSSSRRSVPGASELASDVASLKKPFSAATRSLLAVYAAASDAVAGPFGTGAVLTGTGIATRVVAQTPIPRSGPAAGAVLVAADDPTVLAQMLAVTTFERVASLDVSGTATGTALPNRAVKASERFRFHGGYGEANLVVTSSGPGGTSGIAPRRWLAYRRADGRVYWLPSDGPANVALTDGTLTGAGFQTPRAFVVDSSSIGRIVFVIDLP